jgi:hypothetical protein
MVNMRKFVLQATFLAVLVIGTLLACLPSASADGPPGAEPTTVVDPCFRQDIECYDLPNMNTYFDWLLDIFLPVQEQLPEERIGRLIDGPYGETCMIVDVEGHLECNLPGIPGTPPIAPGS